MPSGYMQQDEYNDLINWLSQQPSDKIDEYAWQKLKPYYREKPVNILQFLYDKEYMGNVYLKKDGKSALYPYWVNLLTKIFPIWCYMPYQLLLMSCSIGVGKSTLLAAMQQYMAHLMGCLKNPAEYYGLMSTDTIVMAMFSTTKDLLFSVSWPKFADGLVLSPWFQRRLGISDQIKKSVSMDLFDNFSIQVGTRVQHAISRDILIAMIDEGNQEITNNQVVKNFNELMKRRESRFQKGFMVPGLVCVASSPQGPDDFISTCIEEYKNDPSVLILDNVAQWEVKRGVKHYCGRTFKLFLGDNKTQDAFIIPKGADTSAMDQTLIREIPIEHYKEFASPQGLHSAIRDILGLRSTAVSAWLPSRQAINEVMTEENLFLDDEIHLSVFDSFTMIVESTNIALLDKIIEVGLPVNIGLDYGRTHDGFGLAIANSTRVFDGLNYGRKYTVYGIVDFYAKDKRGVPSKAIQDYISWLADRGLKIRCISYDRPGVETAQNLIIKGFTTDYLSVDTSYDPYTILRAVIMSQQIRMPYHSKLLTELANLQDTGKKVDHPDIMFHEGKKCEGSKDLADALASAVYKSFQQVPLETSYEILEKTQKALDAVKYLEYQQMSEKVVQEQSQSDLGSFYLLSNNASKIQPNFYANTGLALNGKPNFYGR